MDGTNTLLTLFGHSNYRVLTSSNTRLVCFETLGKLFKCWFKSHSNINGLKERVARRRVMPLLTHFDNANGTWKLLDRFY